RPALRLGRRHRWRRRWGRESARVYGRGVGRSEREQVFDVCSQDSPIHALLPDGVRGQNTPGSRKVLELPCGEGAELIPALCIVPMVGHKKTFTRRHGRAEARCAVWSLPWRLRIAENPSGGMVILV